MRLFRSACFHTANARVNPQPAPVAPFLRAHPSLLTRARPLPSFAPFARPRRTQMDALHRFQVFLHRSQRAIEEAIEQALSAVRDQFAVYSPRVPQRKDCQPRRQPTGRSRNVQVSKRNRIWPDGGERLTRCERQAPAASEPYTEQDRDRFRLCRRHLDRQPRGRRGEAPDLRRR